LAERPWLPGEHSSELNIPHISQKIIAMFVANFPHCLDVAVYVWYRLPEDGDEPPKFSVVFESRTSHRG
jgi:hypothetical protein